jgi:hypothetical protein
MNIDIGQIDFALLRKQKLHLLEKDDSVEADGIIFLIDRIQDEAAKVVGEEAVFGPPSDD